MASRQDPTGLIVPGVGGNLSSRSSIPAIARRSVSAIPTFIVVLDVKTNSLYSSTLETGPFAPRRIQRNDSVIGSLIPLDRFKIQLLIRRTIRTGRVQKDEFRIHVGNGKTRIVESETGILLDDLRQISKVIVTSRDVTDQRSVQDALQKSEQRIHALIHGSSELIAFVNRRARVLFTGPPTKSILGYREDELVGRNTLLLVHPDDRMKVRQSFGDLLATPGSTITTRHRIRHKDGSWRTVSGTSTNLLADPAVGAIVLRYRDVTDEESADLRNAFLTAFARATDEAVIGQTLDGTIVTWNDGAEHLYGYSPAEAVGRSMSLIAPPDGLNDISAGLDRVKRGESVDWHEAKRVTKRGSTIDVAVKLSPVYLTTGELIGATSLARDMTSRMGARRERERLLTELKNAHAELHALRGMLPICAWCKKVRDDKGRWKHVEFYFESRAHVQFTHGICPECIVKYHQRSDKNITDVEGL